MFTLADIAGRFGALDNLDQKSTQRLLASLRFWDSRGVFHADALVTDRKTRLFSAASVHRIRLLTALIARVGVDSNSVHVVSAFHFASPGYLREARKAIDEGKRVSLVLSQRRNEPWDIGDSAPSDAVVAITLNLNALFAGLPPIEG